VVAGGGGGLARDRARVQVPGGGVAVAIVGAAAGRVGGRGAERRLVAMAKVP
jgi:hypothetical protein